MSSDATTSVSHSSNGSAAVILPSTAPPSGPSPAPQVAHAVKKKSWLSHLAWLWAAVVYLWYLYWNIPGLINILSARSLAKTGKCTIVGYNSKFIFAYPLIPAGFTVAIASALGASAFSVSIFYAFVLIWTFIVMGEDVRGRSAWAVLGFTTAIVAIYAALVYTGWAVNSGIYRFLLQFKPNVNGGFCMLISIGLIPLMILAFIRARVNSRLVVDQNTFIAQMLEKTTDFPISDWRLRSTIMDIFEAVWMGSRELMLMSNFGSGRSARNNLDDDGRDGFHLPNVPGGGRVENLVLKALAVWEVNVVRPDSED